MSNRGNLARLKRLERQMQLERAGVPDLSCPGFVIAPELARAIVEAHTRLDELLSHRRLYNSQFASLGQFERPDPAAEEGAAARLAELLRDVHCPPDYWAKQADTDRRLRDAGNEPPVQSDGLTQVKARLIVFDGSPGGAAWRRIMDLSYGKRSRAEQAELDELHRRYPGMPLKHYVSWYEERREWEEVMRDLKERFPPIGGRPSESNTWYEREEALWKRVQRYQ
jgi:hypothetical protein